VAVETVVLVAAGHWRRCQRQMQPAILHPAAYSLRAKVARRAACTPVPTLWMPARGWPRGARSALCRRRRPCCTASCTRRGQRDWPVVAGLARQRHPHYHPAAPALPRMWAAVARVVVRRRAQGRRLAATATALRRGHHRRQLAACWISLLPAVPPAVAAVWLAAAAAWPALASVAAAPAATAAVAGQGLVATFVALGRVWSRRGGVPAGQCRCPPSVPTTSSCWTL